MAFNAKEYNHNYYVKNKDHLRELNQKWRQENAERDAIMHRNNYDRDPSVAKQRAFHHRLKKSYRMEPEEYEAMVKLQNGACAICGRTEEKRRLSVDHCHQTGKVRGLLCNTCNAGLGNFRDAIAHLQAAIRYLESRG